MKEYKDSEYLSGGKLRRGRQPNPTIVTGMLINEGAPPKAKQRSAAMKRDSKGQFVPKDKKKKTTTKKKKSTKKKSTKAVAKRNSNPSSPAKKTKKKKRATNPSTSTKNLLKNAAIGAGAFVAPGLIEVLSKGKINAMVAKLFAKKNAAGKAMLDYKAYAKAKLAINAAFFGIGYYVTKKGKSKKYRAPILTGLGGAAAVALLDVLLAPKKTDDTSAKFRMVLGLPAVQPGVYPYKIDGAAKAPAVANTNTPTTSTPTTASNTANTSSGSSSATNQLSEADKRAIEQAADQHADPFGLGNVTEYWDRERDPSLGNVEEEWVLDGYDEEDEIYDDVHDEYSDDEAAYGGGSYLPSGSVY